MAEHTVAEKQVYCSGCRDDFYNHRRGPGFDGSTHCWSLNTAEVVTRYRIGWWTPMDNVANFQKVTTLSCHSEPGRFAYLKQLPSHLKVGAK